MTATFESSNLPRPNWISARAKLVIKGKNNDSMWGEARIEKRRLAQLNWTAGGHLLHELPLDAAGKGHGFEVERDDSGRIVWCAHWVHGSMHGPVMQFDERGRPLFVTHFVHGRGTDIWMNCGEVAEVRELLDGKLHGLVRWGNPRRPYDEGHFCRGERHGIFREWLPSGHLRKGFPRFYLKDSQVSRRVYEAAQAEAVSLPRYNARDDFNTRTTPKAVRLALECAKYLRRNLALVDHLRRLAGPPR
jgi:hypothetical protein